MPAVVRGRQATPTIVAPVRIARALMPEIERRPIPSRQTLSTGAVPFAGELREDQSSNLITVPNAQSVTLVTLRRAWLYVGWILDPGDAAAAGLSVSLRILTRGVNGLTAPVAVAVGSPLAVTNLTVGAPCELVCHNATGTAVKRVRASIWGMGER